MAIKIQSVKDLESAQKLQLYLWEQKLDSAVLVSPKDSGISLFVYTKEAAEIAESKYDLDHVVGTDKVIGKIGNKISNRLIKNNLTNFKVKMVALKSGKTKYTYFFYDKATMKQYYRIKENVGG